MKKEDKMKSKKSIAVRAKIRAEREKKVRKLMTVFFNELEEDPRIGTKLDKLILGTLEGLRIKVQKMPV